jgi:hypothetical protein
MTGLRIIWLLLAATYLVFFSWYTSFEGPLTDAEIEHYMSRLETRSEGGNPEQLAIVRKFMESDTGDDFVMWNVIDFHEQPLQVTGVEAGETSAEVLGKYMAYMYPALFSRASHPVIFGSAAGKSMEEFGVRGLRVWDQGAGMRYRSRRDMLDIVVNPDFQGPHQFKVAAIEKTFAFPADPWFQLGDPRLVLALLWLVLGLSATVFSGRRTQG